MIKMKKIQTVLSDDEAEKLVKLAKLEQRTVSNFLRTLIYKEISDENG